MNDLREMMDEYMRPRPTVDFEFTNAFFSKYPDETCRADDLEEVGVVPSVGDWVEITLEPSGEVVQLRCVKRLWSLIKRGGAVVTLTLDLPPHN